MKRLAPLLVVAGCGRIAFDPRDDATGGDAGGPPWPTLTGQWTWIGGSNIGAQPGVYGTRSVAAPSNWPGSRDNGAFWGTADTFYLFGGYGFGQSGANNLLNDLWRYDVASGNWTWLAGATTTLTAGSYGTQGVSAPSNQPGARNDANGWIDAEGRPWLFGGNGRDDAGTTGSLGDVWRFDSATGEWTWLAGSNLNSQPPSYGTLDVPSATNTPGARDSTVIWSTPSGIWMYGGTSSPARFADLWQFDVATTTWTWRGGTQAIDAPPVYGVLGQPSPTATPGTRYSGCAWVAADALWLFGGGSASGRRNDLWRYSLADRQWTWMGGPTDVLQPGRYGARGVFDPDAVPGARIAGACWTDARGNFWLFGGAGIDAAGTGGSLNDLWVYSPSLGQWAWVAGGDRGDVVGVYGTRGVADIANTPGSRSAGSAWTHGDGSLWLFGGDFAYDSVGMAGSVQDLWRFGPAP